MRTLLAAAILCLLACRPAFAGEAAEESRALARLSVLPISIEARPDDSAVFDFARRHRLTFYDAVYLELATRRKLSLATLDHDLIAAAKAERVQLVTAV